MNGWTPARWRGKLTPQESAEVDRICHSVARREANRIRHKAYEAMMSDLAIARKQWENQR